MTDLDRLQFTLKIMSIFNSHSRTNLQKKEIYTKRIKRLKWRYQNINKITMQFLVINNGNIKKGKNETIKKIKNQNRMIYIVQWEESL